MRAEATPDPSQVDLRPGRLPGEHGVGVAAALAESHDTEGQGP